MYYAIYGNIISNTWTSGSCRSAAATAAPRVEGIGVFVMHTSTNGTTKCLFYTGPRFLPDKEFNIFPVGATATFACRIQQATFEQLNRPELQGITSVVMVGGFSSNTLVQVIVLRQARDPPDAFPPSARFHAVRSRHVALRGHTGRLYVSSVPPQREVCQRSLLYACIISSPTANASTAALGTHCRRLFERVSGPSTPISAYSFIPGQAWL